MASGRPSAMHFLSKCCLQHLNTPFDSPRANIITTARNHHRLILAIEIMLTELERAIRFGALLGRIESLREEINRIHDSEPADFAAFVAQIPVSNDPDWDVEDSLSNDVCNAWAAWEDATLESHTVSSPESSNAAAAAATSSPLSNERLDKSNLKDTQSDASTLAILVQKFIYRPKRIKRDDGDGQPSAMQYLGQSSNGSPSGLKASATTALTAFSTTATLQSTSVHLQPPTSASASSSASASTSVSVSASASASASADVAHGIVTQIRPEGSKVRRMRHFFRLRDELVSLLSVFNVLENQEEDFEQARKQCIENYRRRRGQRTAHPLRQSMTMEEQEAISDKRLGKQKERTVWW